MVDVYSKSQERRNPSLEGKMHSYEIPFITHRLFPRTTPIARKPNTHIVTAPSKSGLSQGDILKGKYEVLSLIGEGGMSRVYLARDLELKNKHWAIKEVDRWAQDSLGRPIEQSLASEAELLSKLQHPTIVGIADIERNGRFIYVVMDHVEGRSLDQVVIEEGPQQEEDVQKWMLQLCDALAYLHRQNPPIIYRDMKPNNIMLHPDGYVKLIDLGVAREYKDDQKNDTVAFGTTGYAAPEQYGKAQTDSRTDIYGLGATMWHLLTGKAAPVEFPLPNCRSISPKIGEGFANVIIPKCVQLSRHARYQSCEELAADLQIYKQLTKDFHRHQQIKVIRFAACAASSFLCMVVALAFLCIRSSYLQQSFEYHLSVGQTQLQSNPEMAQEEFLQAIAIAPSLPQGYLALIESYKIDGLFTPSEKSQFDEVYLPHLASLKTSPEYAGVAYEIGKLYWYFFSYGKSGSYEENQQTRIKASQSYFADAARDSNFAQQATAKNYAEIATFTTNINMAIMQGEESEELYKNFWNNLVQLANRAQSEPVEIVKIDSCVFVIHSIDTYMNKFKSLNACTQTEISNLLSQVITLLETTHPVAPQNQELRSRMVEDTQFTVWKKMHALYAGNASLRRGE